MSIAARRLSRTKTADTGVIAPEVAGAQTLGSTSYAIPGGAVYVDFANGNNANAGTIGSPKRTIASAIAAAPNGGTVVCRGGTYLESVGGVTKNITIQNYPGEVVWVDGADVVTGWTLSGGDWVKTGWTAEFNHSSPSPGNLSSYLDGTSEALAYWPDGCWIDGVRQVLVTGNPAPGEWSVDYAANTATLGSDPTGKTVHLTARELSFLLQAAVTIRGIGIRRFAAGLSPYGGMIDIVSAGSGSVLEHVWVTDAGIQGIAVIGQNVTLRNVTVQDCGGSGIGGNNAQDLLVDHVLVRRINQRGWKAEPISSGIKITKSQRVRVLHSRFEDCNRCDGIWFDQGCGNGVIAHCAVSNSQNYAIEVELGGIDWIVAGNHIINCANTRYGVAGFDTQHLRMWNNRVEPTSSWDIGYITDERRNVGDWGYSVTDFPGTSGNVEIANNLLDGGRGRLYRLYADGDSTSPAVYANSATILVQGNVVTSNAGSSTNATRLAGWTNASQTRIDYATYASLQAAAPVVGSNALYDGTLVPGSMLNSLAVSVGAAIPSDVAAVLGVPAGSKSIGPPRPAPIAAA